MKSEKMLHTALNRDNAAKYAIVPGNPDRCLKIAEHLDKYKKLAQNREHTTYEGYLEGEKVLVTSTGMGGPSAAICMEELVSIGVDTFIRVGTGASTSDVVDRGDVVIPNGAVRMEGTGLHYLPVEFPAVPDFELVKHLECAAVRCGFVPKIGVTITKDSFFTEKNPQDKPIGYELINKWNAYKKGGAQSSSMESAALFLVAASLGVRAATVLVSATSNNTTKGKDGIYPSDVEENAIRVGIEGIRETILADRKKKQEHAK